MISMCHCSCYCTCICHGFWKHLIINEYKMFSGHVFLYCPLQEQINAWKQFVSRLLPHKLWKKTTSSTICCQSKTHAFYFDNKFQIRSDSMNNVADKDQLLVYSRAAGPPGSGPPGSGPPHGGHTGLVPGSGEERCLRAAGSTHIWRHSALFSPVNTKTSERASAAVVTICRVTYYIALIRCRSIQLSEEAFYFLVRLKHAP